MASVPSQILDSIVQALRDAEAFRVVSLEDASITDAPRAVVAFDGYELLSPDDSADRSWGRLRASVSVYTLGVSPAATAARATELCQAAMAAIAADPFRGGLCCDLPVGKATELGRCQVIRTLKRPEAGMSFDLRCHFETEAGT
jgi:hypothetical protein